MLKFCKFIVYKDFGLWRVSYAAPLSSCLRNIVAGLVLLATAAASVENESLIYAKDSSFMMGSDSLIVEGNQMSFPKHKVLFTYNFWMSKYEVTRQEYLNVVGIDPSPVIDFDEHPDYPVSQVSWYDAVLYCMLRSEKEGLENCYDTVRYGRDYWYCDITKNGYRLPTESEWEYSCLAGHEPPVYWDGDPLDCDAYVWHALNSGLRPNSVGSKLSNKLGLYDMLGNLFEMVHDTYQDYPSEDQIDPFGPINRYGATVIRGLGFHSPPAAMNALSRLYFERTRNRVDVGFRTVRTVVEDPTGLNENLLRSTGSKAVFVRALLKNELLIGLPIEKLSRCDIDILSCDGRRVCGSGNISISARDDKTSVMRPMRDLPKGIYLVKIRGQGLSVNAKIALGNSIHRY